MQSLGKTLWQAWMKLAHFIGLVNEYLLLGIVYFVFIGIYAIIYDGVMIFSKKPKSMWRQFEHQPKSLEALEQQF